VTLALRKGQQVEGEFNGSAAGSDPVLKPYYLTKKRGVNQNEK